MSLPDMAVLMRGGVRLAKEAWRHGLAGETKRAGKLLGSCLAVAESLADEPLLFSQCARYAVDEISVHALAALLSETRLSADVLAELDHVLRAGAGQENTMRRALIAERALALETLKHPENYGRGPRLSTGKIQLYELTGLIELDALHYLEVIGKLIDAHRQPFPARIETCRRLAAEADQVSFPPARSRLVTDTWLPRINPLVDQEASNLARLRLARSAVAVERFRLDYGRLPRNLSELVPDYIDEVPEDPFDGKPLRYKTLEAGHVVYSVGANTTDDDGAETEHERTGDIVFRVTR
jgi:hypothetical protein